MARALEVLPVISAAFAGGEISYSKVRATTRVALPADQQEWLTQALSSTGSQLERAASGVRRDRKSTRLNSSHTDILRMPSSA